MPFACKNSQQYSSFTLIDSYLPDILRAAYKNLGKTKTPHPALSPRERIKMFQVLTPFKSLPLKLLCRMLSADPDIRAKYETTDTNWLEQVMEVKLSEVVFRMALPVESSFYYLVVEKRMKKVTTKLMNYREIRGYLFERSCLSLFGRKLTVTIGLKCRMVKSGGG